MFVVATAGHVDHGKSTLIRRLTGMEPDRWALERSRGVSIDLGFCWTTIPDDRTVAFVDVPGHERYLGNALAGVGPSTSVLLVVAADEGWMPQTEEHLKAIDAFGIRHGVVAVTRSDLADPAPVLAQARERLVGNSLSGVPVVAISAATGLGIDVLMSALRTQLNRVPLADPAGPARMWLDRAFSVRGAGTVVTGTLVCGTMATGDRMYLPRLDRTLQVRSLQCLGQAVDNVCGPARVAAVLRHIHPDDLTRGDALVTPGRWLAASVVDVRHRADPEFKLPKEMLVHAGTGAVPGTVRVLGTDTIRIRLGTPLPLHIGDRLALRAPGNREIVGATVLDPEPPSLQRRGAARARAAVLATVADQPDGAAELRRRGVASGALLAAIGAIPPGAPLVRDWYVDAECGDRIRAQVGDIVSAAAAADPYGPGPTVEAVRQRLNLPAQELVSALLPTGVCLDAGHVVPVTAPSLPAESRTALDRLRARLAVTPFDAPDATEIRAFGLNRAVLDAAVRLTELVRVGDEYLLADAPARALTVLRALPQPFTASQARAALKTSRRVVIPLLEYLDGTGATRCLPDRRRMVQLAND